MRILIINPNTTAALTSLMLETGRAVAAPNTQLVGMTAPRGFPYISNRAEAQIGGAVVLEMLAEAFADVDGAIVAAYGDPGLRGAREMFDIPVVGVSEAAMLTACLLGDRFVIVTFAAALCGWYRECVALHQMTHRCAGVVALDQSFSSIAEVGDDKLDSLVALANRAVADRGADVTIFAGAPLSGLASKARLHIPTPVIDPIAAAVKQVEALIALRLRKPSIGSFRRPAAKSSIGLPTPLASYMARVNA